jgi:hypothetical protein
MGDKSYTKLIESMNKLSSSLDDNFIATKRYNRVILNLTIVVILLTVVQVLISSFATNFSWPIKIGFAAIPFMLLYLGIKDS